jgi:hypothetical protein
VCYFELTTEIFSIFSCVSINGVSRLSEMPWIVCSVSGGGMYTALFGMGIVFTVLYVIGFLALLAILLRRQSPNRDEDSPVEFLYAEYKFYYYELLLMSRRLVLSLFVALYMKSVYIEFLISVLLTASLAVQLSLAPFHHTRDNVCESLVLAALLVSFGRGHPTDGRRQVCRFPILCWRSTWWCSRVLIAILIYPWIVKLWRRIMRQRRRREAARQVMRQ